MQMQARLSCRARQDTHVVCTASAAVASLDGVKKTQLSTPSNPPTSRLGPHGLKWLSPTSSLRVMSAKLKPSQKVAAFDMDGASVCVENERVLRLHIQLTQCTLHRDIHYTHTTHYTLHTTHYTLHTTHYTLHTTHYTLHTTHYTLHTTHYTLHTTHYTLHTTHYTLHTKH
jgi:hypothetical protein